MRNQFGIKLKQLRLEKGYGLREASELAGIDPAEWSRYEDGNSKPLNLNRIDARVSLRKICNVLKNDSYDPYNDLSLLATKSETSKREDRDPLEMHYMRKKNQ